MKHFRVILKSPYRYIYFTDCPGVLFVNVAVKATKVQPILIAQSGSSTLRQYFNPRPVR